VHVVIFITFLHTAWTLNGLGYFIRSGEGVSRRGCILKEVVLAYHNGVFVWVFFSDLGANLLSKAVSGLLDGLVQLEVL